MGLYGCINQCLFALLVASTGAYCHKSFKVIKGHNRRVFAIIIRYTKINQACPMKLYVLCS